MKLIVAVFCCALVVCQAVDLPPEWHLWKSTHQKTYEGEHEELRHHIVWLSNKKYIEEHNKYSEHFGYTLEMNQFGDLVCYTRDLWFNTHRLCKHG